MFNWTIHRSDVDYLCAKVLNWLTAPSDRGR